MRVRKVRLCVLTPVHASTFMGGAEYQISCLLDTLVPTGRYEIHYLAAWASTDFQPHGYRIVPVGKGSGDATIRVPHAHLCRVLRLLKEIEPDVIYQRVACGYTGLAAYYARRHAARLIWHVSSDSDVTPGTVDAGRNPVRRVLEKRSIEYGDPACSSHRDSDRGTGTTARGALRPYGGCRNPKLSSETRRRPSTKPGLSPSSGWPISSA